MPGVWTVTWAMLVTKGHAAAGARLILVACAATKAMVSLTCAKDHV